jgi:serine/threonine protein kinase
LHKFDHLSIIKHYNHFNGEDFLVIEIEYIDRDDLRQLIDIRKNKNQPLPESFIIKLISQTASVLQHIHHKKVVHQNLKPMNILLTLDGNIKLTDFGISKENEISKVLHSTLDETMPFFSS